MRAWEQRIRPKRLLPQKGPLFWQLVSREYGIHDRFEKLGAHNRRKLVRAQKTTSGDSSGSLQSCIVRHVVHSEKVRASGGSAISYKFCDTIRSDNSATCACFTFCGAFCRNMSTTSTIHGSSPAKKRKPKNLCYPSYTRPKHHALSAKTS